MKPKPEVKPMRVWYVNGDPHGGKMPMLFVDSATAHRHARYCFPEESIAKRAARVYCRDVLTKQDLDIEGLIRGDL
jgi:hypothetical protein